MNTIIGKLGGKKFIVALLGLIAVVVAALTGYEIAPETLQTVAAIVSSYLIGQGVADGFSGGKTSSVAKANEDVG